MSTDNNQVLWKGYLGAMNTPIQTIELDCPPGFPRPDQLIAAVIEGTGLDKRDPVSTFFGNFTWDYSDIPADTWKDIRGTLKERIIRLHENGHIRYGSW
jgi:hypothetical protein